MGKRQQELLDLPEDARVLFIKGQKDWVGFPLLLNSEPISSLGLYNLEFQTQLTNLLAIAQMGPELALRPLRQQMKAKTWQITVQEMDHRFVCKTPKEEARICNALGVIAGIWLRGDVPANVTPSAASSTSAATPWNPMDGTEMTMYYDHDLEEAVWTGWTLPGAAKPQVNNGPRDIAGLD